MILQTAYSKVIKKITLKPVGKCLTIGAGKLIIFLIQETLDVVIKNKNYSFEGLKNLNFNMRQEEIERLFIEYDDKLSTLDNVFDDVSTY